MSAIVSGRGHAAEDHARLDALCRQLHEQDLTEEVHFP